MGYFQIIIATLVCIISLICIYYMYYVKKSGNFDGLIRDSVKKSEFTPTQFKVYDKSTETVCNRLIVVDPFNWYIWACRGELYVLNPESGIQCNANSTPAIRVFATEFVETCLRISVNAILNSYTLGNTPVIVPYEITDTSFTILSALNILTKSLVTFDKEQTPIDKHKIVTAESVVATICDTNHHHHHLQRQFAKHAVKKS